MLVGCSRPKEDKQVRLKKADFYALQGREYISESIQLYKELIKAEKDFQLNNGLRLKLGQLYLEIGNYAQAVDCFKGIESEEAKKNLAIAYFKNSQLSDALAKFEKLGKLDDSEYLYYYGMALEERNLYDKSLDVYNSIPKESEDYSKAEARIKAISLFEDTASGQNLKEIIENSPKQEDYPEAGAVILLADEEFEVFEDATAIFDLHFMVKIFNERGKEQFSEIHIGYDSTFEEVELDFARTITPDGTVTYVGEKNIRDVSVYLNYPLYSNARARIISMPEVREGAIVEYRAKIFRKQLVNKKDFVLNYSIQEGEPIKIAKFTVKMPRERDLNYKIINSEYNKFSAKLNPEINIVDNRKVYSWQMENIPEVLPESDMSPISRTNPIIMMSTFDKWEDIYRWWYDLYKDKIKIDKEIEDKIEELTRDKGSQRDKLRSIYNYCAQDIRYVAVEYGQAGYEPHQAKDIYKNKYGDCKDQAILLIAMLKSIGINAYPVLIGTYEHIDLNKDFPTLVFNHCIAVADFEDELIFMDPTGQTVPFGDLPSMDQDRLVFLILDSEYKIVSTPSFDSQKNFSQITMHIKINKDESIIVKRKADTRGIFGQSQRYWLQFTKPKLIEEILKGTANAIAPGARLINYKVENVDDLDKDIILEYEFQSPEFLTKAGSSRLLSKLGSINIDAVVKEERNYPIEYPILFETRIITDIEIPDSLVIKYLPLNLKFNSEWFEFENTYTKKNKTISFSEKYKLKKRLILQDDYKEYKELLEDIARKINQRIILEEK